MLGSGLAGAFPEPFETEPVVYDESPVWSPDGSRVAFFRVTAEGQLERRALSVVRGDGKQRRVLAAGPWISTTLAAKPSWSPDSRTIAFSVSAGTSGAPRTHVYLVDSDGTHFHRLLRNDALSYGPTWSPRGNTIAAAAEIPGRGRGLFLVNADGTDLRLASIQPETDPATGNLPRGLSWAPDGTAIAYSTLSERGNQLYVVATGGGKPRLMTGGCCPSWSRDGRRIAFRRGCGFAVVHREATGPESDESCFQIGFAGASFSPRDDEVVACFFFPKGCSLVVFHVADTTVGPPLRLGIEGWQPVWSPDGRKIAFAREHLYVLTLTADHVTKVRRLT